MNYVMKLSSNGQVSIPAEVRARWRTNRILVVDLGDCIAMRPLPADAVAEVRGKYRDRGPSTERARREAREADALAEPAP